MKQFIAAGLAMLGSVAGAVSILMLTPEKAKAAYDDAWDFVCTWDCGVAWFEPEYGGYTVDGYSSSFFDELPTSQEEAKDWAYYDFWVPAGCDSYSTSFSQTVCLDTAYLHGVGAWTAFASLYQDYSDDELACLVIDERAASRDPNAPYVEGWQNRDAALAALGGCW